MSKFKGDYIFAYSLEAGINPDAFGLETIAGKYSSSPYFGGWFYKTASISPVPIPAALWLFGTALIGLVGFSKRKAGISA